MMRRLWMLSVFLLWAGTAKVAAQMKPCIVIVNTGDEVYKGVLYSVNADSLGVKKEESLVYFKPGAIKQIKIKALKRGFRYKKYLSDDTFNEKNYEKVSKKMVPVRKWGEKSMTMEEELSGSIITSFYTTAMNGFFASIGLMNARLNTVEVNYDPQRYKASLKALAVHSMVYQQQPAAATLPVLTTARTSKGN